MSSFSSVSDPSIEAARLALSSVEEAGGLDLGGKLHPVRLVVENSDGTPEGAVRAVLTLINQREVTAIIGFNVSRSAIPANEAAEKAGVPIISPLSTHPRATAGKRYAFRVSFTDPVQARAMARFAREDLGAATAATLADVADVYAADMVTSFEEAFVTGGGRIVGHETYTTGEEDLRPQLARLRDRGPAVFFMPSYSDVAALLAPQVREVGLGAVMLGTDGWLPKHLISVPELDGSFSSQPWHLELAATIPAARRFVDTWRRVHGGDPDRTAALVYDAVGLLLAALRRAGHPDSEAVRRELAAIEGYAGVSGPITFRDQGGDPRRSVAIVLLKDGGSHLVRLLEPTDVPPR